MSQSIMSHLFPCYVFQIKILFFLFIFLLNINSNYSLKSNEYLGNTGKHLFHFVQVSDIHVTHIGYNDRMKQFEQFCNEIIKTLVKPSVTIVSGDLVHSVSGLIRKGDRPFRTAQFEEEWNMYRDILNRTNVTKYTKWLDIKGNHDTFMDPNPDSSMSFYRMYSNQGHEHSGSYEYTLKTNDGDSYSFVSVDLCPKPGLGGLLNIYGSITNKEMKVVKKLSEQTKNSNTTIFFGHYPLSFTYSSGLKKLMKHAIVYLNGHLHAGFKHLYNLHSDGLLELELGDWKSNRRFRIVTIDSGILSFEDFRFNQSIYAVISNPTAAKFKTSREPLYRLSQSTHIRILVFAQLPISKVDITIDKQYMGSAIQSIDNLNLFVLPWNTSFYNDGNLHEIFVKIKDNANNIVTIKHDFSLSLSTITAWNRSKFLLTVHQPTLILIVLILALCIYILILLYYRYQAKKKSSIFTSRFGAWNRFCLRMTLLCSVDFLYYSLLAFALFHFIGPWYIGFLTKDYFGATFIWGTLIQGTYLPPDGQLVAGNFQLYFFLFPFTYCLSSSCYYHYKQIQSNNNNQRKSHFSRYFRISIVYILFIYILLYVLFWSYVMTGSFKLGFILSPFGLLLIIFVIVLYIKTQRLQLKDFKLLSLNKTNEILRPNTEENFKLV
ncbi:unnamed protein product [Adineta steineri]|uniref:Transmembrane protein 62 n=1 Tax=Adineta steineri TaxID=433720 RepID=A0A818JB53_9BILA|nr:unnamed protein product [Adineta steineri]CAF0731659.1 unnamed protein product [Adineta steineri]CAF3503787.1 unnamed protein product [Adineta steineri]CAF3539652.1 unnamed protein product [Adineta steineri]